MTACSNYSRFSQQYVAFFHISYIFVIFFEKRQNPKEPLGSFGVYLEALLFSPNWQRVRHIRYGCLDLEQSG